MPDYVAKIMAALGLTWTKDRRRTTGALSQSQIENPYRHWLSH